MGGRERENFCNQGVTFNESARFQVTILIPQCSLLVIHAYNTCIYWFYVITTSSGVNNMSYSQVYRLAVEVNGVPSGFSFSF